MENPTTRPASPDTSVVKFGVPTPGPWDFDRDAVWTNANVQGNIICDCPRYKFNDSHKNWTANARLITAAPDMLAALQAMLEQHGGLERSSSTKAARAAIAKATGSAS